MISPKPMSASAVRIHLCGSFRMTSASGDDLTPRGAKACALIALLSTAVAHRKNRVWLQDKLWSDRAREQGAASLRQVLAELRRALGPERSILEANRTFVALDPESIVILDDPSDGEFLEGIDIRDEEFENWLAIERSQRSDRVPLQTPLVRRQPTEEHTPLRVNFHRSGTRHETLSAVEGVLLDQLCCTLRENLMADVVCFPPHNVEDDACDLRITLKAFRLGDQNVGLRVVAEDGHTGVLVWSDTQQVFLQGSLPVESIAVLRLCNQMFDALSVHFSRRVRRPEEAAGGTLLHLALRHLFSMTAEGSQEADRLLRIAQETSPPNGLLAATRAHVRAIQWVERHGQDEETLRDEARRFSEFALEQDPGNSAVLANLANTKLILDRDFFLSEELADRAIALNPGNPFAWWVRSASELYLQDYAKAQRSAVTASSLLGPGPFKFWWDQQKGLTSAMVGSIEDGIRDLRRTHAAAPTFRPALRFLIVLYGLSEDEENAADMIRRLRALEADFTARQLLEDETYPAKLARNERFVNDRSRQVLLNL